MAALRLVLAGLCLWGWGAADVGRPPSPPPSPPPLPCTLWEGEGGPPPRPALLHLRGGPHPPPAPGPAPTSDPDVTFDVTDPWGALAELWGPPWTPPECELSPTVPLLRPPPWAPALAPRGVSLAPGGPCWVATLATPTRGLTVLLQGPPRPPGAPATPATAALSILTLTPHPWGSLGASLDLHCSFSAPPGPFALQWRHHDRGSGRLLLAYDSATSRLPVATEPGVRLLLGGLEGATRQVTLRLPPLTVARGGTYICSIFLPRAQAQQLLHLRVLEPPKVSVAPSSLVVAPGTAAELRCEATGYFPLDVEVRWLRRAGGRGPLTSPLGETVAESWSRGHRRGPDGTFGRSSGLRLVPARPQHHGDVYICLVAHEALATPRRRRLRLEVAGAVGPSVGDAVGLGLVGYGLCGLCRWLCPTPPQKTP